MTVAPHEVLLWLDVETTGVDLVRDHLLEVAAAVTEIDREFTPVGASTFSLPIRTPPLSLAAVDPAVLAIHSRSGLWAACAEAQSLEMVSARFGDWLSNIGLFDGPSVYLAGRSVHFDRQWLARFSARSAGAPWLPRLNLSHRHFDMTSIKMFATLMGLQYGVPDDAHRALDDVEADIDLARYLVAARTP